MRSKSLRLGGLAVVAWLAACGPIGVALDPPGSNDSGASLDGGFTLDAGDGTDGGFTLDAGGGTDGGTDGGFTPDAGDGTDGGFRPDAGDAGDGLAPWIVRTRPDDGDASVQVTTDLEVEFSESMDPQSVALTATPPVIFGSPQWSEEDTIVRLTPVAPLAYLQPYSVSVQGTDVAGNALSADAGFAFVTVPAPDVTVPSLQTTEPSNGAPAVAVETGLRIVFSEPMSLTSVHVTVTPLVALGTFSWNVAGDELTVAPLAALDYSTTYVIELRGMDLAGNPLPAAPGSTFTFTTRPAPDVTPPVLLSSTPGQGATAVPPETRLVLTFDEPIAAASLQVTVVPPADQGVPTWSDGGRTATFATPVERWVGLTDYSLTIVVADLPGNGASFQRSFTTGADVTPPVVVATSPSDGAVGVALDAGISLTFDELMDHASVEAAFAVAGSAALDGGAVELDGGVFEWAGQVMTYRPPRPFQWGEDVSVSLAAGSADLAGNAMTSATSIGFRARRRATATLYATGDTAEPVTAFADGYLTAPSSCTPAVVPNDRWKALAGSATTSGQHHRGFVSFSIAPLSALENLVVVEAILNVTQTSCRGTPFAFAYGSRIEAWHVSYGPMVLTGSCLTPNLSNRRYSLSTTVIPGPRSATVTAAVQSDWATGASRGWRSQYMLRTAQLPATTTGENSCEFATFNTVTSTKPTLVVTYEYD